MSSLRSPKSVPGVISPGYNIAADEAEGVPNPDLFDPIAWFEGTGVDLGLPDDYPKDAIEAGKKSREKYIKGLAAEGALPPPATPEEGF